MDQIREALKELNLNEKQAEVYLSALFLGEATATEIAKKNKHQSCNNLRYFKIIN